MRLKCLRVRVAFRHIRAQWRYLEAGDTHSRRKMDGLWTYTGGDSGVVAIVGSIEGAVT